MATALVPSTPATRSPTSFADLSEDVLLHLLSRPSSNPNRELSPEDLARLEAVCYALRRPLLLPPNRRHSVVETAARARCLRHPLLARVPADLLRGMAAQRCGGSWLRVLRFAWAVEDAWGLRREAEEEALRGETRAPSAGARNSGELASAVYAGDYCSFQIKTSGELWVYGSGSRDGSPLFTLPPASNQPPPDQPALIAAPDHPAPDQPAPNEPALARDGNPAAGQGWAAAALAAGLAAVRLGTGGAAVPAGSAATGSAVAGAERPGAHAQQQVQQRREGARGRRGALRTQIVVGGSADAEGNGGNGRNQRGNGVIGENREEAEGGFGERVAQVAGGRAFTVILTRSGSVYTMGQDTNGCCGHGQDGVGKKFPQPKLVEALRGVPCQQVATGRSHVLVLARDGTVYAFGAGGNGRLGLGDTDDRCRPTVVEGLRPEVLAAMLSGNGGQMDGNNGTGGSSGDTGGNNNETGGSSSSSSISSSSSSDPYGQYRIVSVAAGASHSLAVTAAGVVLAFGRGHSGQLGGAQGWGSWAGGAQGWGTWAGGAQGLGNEREEGMRGGGARVGQVQGRAGGVSRVHVGRRAGGSAATAGNTTASATAAWLMGAGVRVIKVAASVDYSAALDCLGRVHMWGSGYCGCLGNGSEANAVLPRVVEGLLHTRIVQVTLGKRKTLALDDQGRVLAFGWTAFGGLGVAAGRDKVFAPMPVEALEGKRVVQISTGAYHTVALCHNGTCIGFGDNEQGQLELH
ncbi:unnamed protein product [Closterium sp. Yama58-4]|nr:unnamed protein product [Closterium sp. Yama58-4]